MKKSRILSIGSMILSVIGSMAAATGASALPSPIVTWTPAEPKWGETLVVTYDPGAPKAAFSVGDEVYLQCSCYVNFKSGLS